MNNHTRYLKYKNKCRLIGGMTKLQPALLDPKIYLQSEKRDLHLIKRIRTSFKDLSKKGTNTFAIWGRAEYDIPIDKISFVLDLLLNGEDEEDIYIIDVGCGSGLWGLDLFQKIITQLKRIINIGRKKLHIINFTGENLQKFIIPTEHCIYYYIPKFDIQNLSTSLESLDPDMFIVTNHHIYVLEEILYDIKEIDLIDLISILKKIKNKVAFIISSCCFRHLEDPLGTFVDFCNLLKVNGIISIDKIYFYTNEDFIEDKGQTRSSIINLRNKIYDMEKFLKRIFPIIDEEYAELLKGGSSDDSDEDNPYSLLKKIKSLQERLKIIDNIEYHLLSDEDQILLESLLEPPISLYNPEIHELNYLLLGLAFSQLFFIYKNCNCIVMQRINSHAVRLALEYSGFYTAGYSDQASNGVAIYRWLDKPILNDFTEDETEFVFGIMFCFIGNSYKFFKSFIMYIRFRHVTQNLVLTHMTLDINKTERINSKLCYLKETREEIPEQDLIDLRDKSNIEKYFDIRQLPANEEEYFNTNLCSNFIKVLKICRLLIETDLKSKLSIVDVDTSNDNFSISKEERLRLLELKKNNIRIILEALKISS